MNMSLSHFILSFLLGIVLAVPYLIWVDTLNFRKRIHALGSGLLVAALIYVGFALYGADSSWLAVELAGCILYGGAIVMALRGSALWLVFGWAAHPIWDVVLHLQGPGNHKVPPWYAIACISFDILIAIYLLRDTRKNSSDSRSHRNLETQKAVE